MRSAVILGCFMILPGVAVAGAKPADQIRTTSQANRETIGGAIISPLRDINVLRTKIPQILLDAMAEPYRVPAGEACDSIPEEVALLDAALGSDLDVVPVKNNEDLIDRGRRSVTPAVLGALSDFERGAIPFRGWVRKLTGAEAHDRLVSSAMTAGAVRRGYLKGLGEARNCGASASPAHLSVTPQSPVDDGRPFSPVIGFFSKPSQAPQATTVAAPDPTPPAVIVTNTTPIVAQSALPAAPRAVAAPPVFAASQGVAYAAFPQSH